MKSKLGISLLMILLIACSTEQRIAYKYQKNIANIPILIRNSAEVFLTNSKQYIPKNISDEEYEKYLDTAYYSSDLIKNIIPDNFSQDFFSNFTSNFQNKNFKVYLIDSITNFIKQSKPKIIIEIIQLEIEENNDYYYQNSDKTQGVIDKSKYLHITDANIHNYDFENIIENYYDTDIKRNALAVNLWLKIDIIQKNDKHSSETVFMQYKMYDIIEGDFVEETIDKVSFIYTIDSIGVADLWKAHNYSANKFCNITTEYFINNIIENITMETTNKHKKYHWEYRSKTGRLLPTYKDGEYEVMRRE